jgi:hypothetical protein
MVAYIARLCGRVDLIVDAGIVRKRERKIDVAG